MESVSESPEERRRRSQADDAADPRRWSDMGRAERYALVQSQLLLWILVLVLAYLLATNVSVVLAALFVAPIIALFTWMTWRVIRQQRRP
jgi:Flp pilus assembly protein TadB